MFEITGLEFCVKDWLFLPRVLSLFLFPEGDTKIVNVEYMMTDSFVFIFCMVCNLYNWKSLLRYSHSRPLLKSNTDITVLWVFQSQKHFFLCVRFPYRTFVSTYCAQIHIKNFSPILCPTRFNNYKLDVLPICVRFCSQNKHRLIPL